MMIIMIHIIPIIVSTYLLDLRGTDGVVLGAGTPGIITAGIPGTALGDIIHGTTHGVIIHGIPGTIHGDIIRGIPVQIMVGAIITIMVMSTMATIGTETIGTTMAGVMEMIITTKSTAVEKEVLYLLQQKEGMHHQEEK